MTYSLPHRQKLKLLSGNGVTTIMVHIWTALWIQIRPQTFWSPHITQLRLIRNTWKLRSLMATIPWCSGILH